MCLANLQSVVMGQSRVKRASVNLCIQCGVQSKHIGYCGVNLGPGGSAVKKSRRSPRQAGWTTHDLLLGRYFGTVLFRPKIVIKYRYFSTRHHLVFKIRLVFVYQERSTGGW